MSAGVRVKIRIDKNEHSEMKHRDLHGLYLDPLDISVYESMRESGDPNEEEYNQHVVFLGCLEDAVRDVSPLITLLERGDVQERLLQIIDGHRLERDDGVYVGVLTDEAQGILETVRKEIMAITNVSEKEAEIEGPDSFSIGPAQPLMLQARDQTGVNSSAALSQTGTSAQVLSGGAASSPLPLPADPGVMTGAGQARTNPDSDPTVAGDPAGRSGLASPFQQLLEVALALEGQLQEARSGWGPDVPVELDRLVDRAHDLAEDARRVAVGSACRHNSDPGGLFRPHVDLVTTLFDSLLKLGISKADSAGLVLRVARDLFCLRVCPNPTCAAGKPCA